ncbi:MAG: hypothetical protein Q8K75_01850 [Chlamydiales bacterium]|nr:hypothetical protein [Chlamydiales bacterium]
MRKLFILLVVGLVCVSWFGWTYRVRLVSDTLTKNLGVHAEVSDVELSTHGLILRGFTVGASKDKDARINPALVADSIRITLQPLNWWKEPVVISEIAADGVYVILDMSMWESYAANWAHLFAGFSKAKKKSPVVEGAHEHSGQNQKGYIIDHVVVTNIHVTLEKRNLASLSSATPAIARLDLYDIGRNSPRTLQQTAELVIGAILEQATISHPKLSAVTDGVISSADEELKKVLKTIKQQYRESGEKGVWKKVQSFFDWGQ